MFKRFRNSLALELNLWHACIFIASSSVLFALLYFFLAQEVERKDREVLDTKIKEYTLIYRSGGVQALRRYIGQEGRRQKPLLVRLVDRFGNDQLFIVPEDWIEFDPNSLKGGEIQGWVRMPKDAESDFTLSSAVLGDGSTLLVGRSANNQQMLLLPLRKIFYTVMIPVVGLAFLGGALFAHRALRPVREVVQTAKSIISTGDLNKRVPKEEAGGELGEMAQLFNQVLEKNQQLIKSMRDSLDNVAHDLRTPLARLRASAEMSLRQGLNQQNSEQALQDCIEEADRLLTMLKALMEVAEAESGVMPLNLERVDVRILIEEAIELYEYVAEEKQIRMVKELPVELGVFVDKVKMRQAFANLLDNALKYTQEGGVVTIRAAQTRDREVKIEFEDNGPGVPQAEQERIWERLYRGDKSRSQRGLGLGLSLVRAIVQAHRGYAGVSSVEGKGSTFFILLPSKG